MTSVHHLTTRLTALVALFALAVPALAHRLDEYLQATRIAVARDRIELHLDLTPGVAIFPKLLPLIDPDGNGRISRRERDAYAQQVLREIHLEVDHRPVSLGLKSVSFPPRADMEGGEGVIQLTAVARFPKLKAGSHEIQFRNDHLPAISVFLVNALVPKEKSVSITRQERDELQRDYRLELEIGGD